MISDHAQIGISKASNSQHLGKCLVLLTSRRSYFSANLEFFYRIDFNVADRAFAIMKAGYFWHRGFVCGCCDILKSPDSTHTKFTVFIVAILVAIAKALDPGTVNVEFC